MSMHANVKPILFSMPMVQALRQGRKTQTRRIVKPRRLEPWEIIGERDDGTPWPYWMDEYGDYHDVVSPYGRPGDLLWGRERFSYDAAYDNGRRGVGAAIWYWADGNPADGDYWGRPRPSIHMPRWASRITLRLTDVRVERLQDISGVDAIAEGIEYGDGAWHTDESGAAYRRDEYGWFVPGQHRRHNSPIHAYRDLWERLHGTGTWAKNDWVWALTFQAIARNVDAVLKEAA